MRIKLLLLVSMVMLVPRVRAQDFVPRGDALQRDVQQLLRALRYAGTVNTAAANSSLPDLLTEFGQWKAQLEDILLDDRHEQFVSLSDKAPLVAKYFELVKDLVRIKQLTAPPLQWSQWGERFDLRAPRAVVWHNSATMQRLWAQTIAIVKVNDLSVSLRLKDAVVESLQIVTIAHSVNDNSHLQAVKYLIYTTLYQQLARNAYLRGDVDGEALLPPAGYEQRDLRRRIIRHLHREQQSTHLRHALLTAMPQLQVPAKGLQMPLLKNWHLYEQLSASHPQLVSFSTPELAEKMYARLSGIHKLALEVNSAEDMYRYLLLVEYLLVPRQLDQALQTLPVDIDGSSTSMITLQHVAIRSRANALRGLLSSWLQFSHGDELALHASINQRVQELQKMSLRPTIQWYESAVAQLTDSKDTLRQDFTDKVLLSVQHVTDIENSAADQPVRLSVLRRALLHSLYDFDFSGEVQESLGAVLRQRDYLVSRKVFYQEVHRHLARLLPETRLSPQELTELSYDDIITQYIDPALIRLEEHEQKAVMVISRRANINHMVQLKSLLRYGYWFGYFNDYGESVPTINMLPLTDPQQRNYWQELKHVYFDQYPFLLLKKDGKQLYQVLATMIKDKDIETVDKEKIWSVLSAALNMQYSLIKAKLAEIDRATSLQDIKHLAAGSPMLTASMKDFDGLYPLHEQFAKRYRQPSKFHHNWEAINMDYVGNFFTVMIGYHLGGWLLRRATLGTAGAHVLSYLNPIFGASMPYGTPLLHAMWGVILLEYFVAMPYHTFVVKPQQLRELQSYYHLGDQRRNLINGTYLSYYLQERNGHYLQYAMDMSMHGLFVGWWMYNLKFSQLIPRIKENNLQKLLQRVGITGKPDAKMLNVKNIRERAKRQIDSLDNSSKVSRHYRIEQIKSAERKLISQIQDKTQAIKVAAIEHEADFKALGIEPVFNYETIAKAYSIVRYGYKTGVYSEAFYQRAHQAMQQLRMTMTRRLKMMPLEIKKGQYQEDTYQRALGEAVAESLPFKRGNVDQALQKFYSDAQTSSNTAIKDLFEGYNFKGVEGLEIKYATADEMREILKHLRTIGYSTRRIKTLQDVREHRRAIKERYDEVFKKYSVSPGANDTPHKEKNRNRLRQAWKSIEYYLKYGYFKEGGS